MMNEKRFKLDFDIDKIKQRFFVKIGKKVQIIDQERNHRIRDLYNACEVLNEQQEEITYWKHRVSSLLMILSQFDNEKVKKLLEELEDE